MKGNIFSEEEIKKFIDEFKNLPLQNNMANFNQSWHKASLSKRDSSLFKWKDVPISIGN